MKIGNIITDTPINVGVGFNVVKSIDDVIVGLPTLIIGYSIVKENFGDDLDFVNREINGFKWTFSKVEHVKYHTIDLNTFIDKCINDSIAKINYVFVDPILNTKHTIKKIIRKINSLENIITYRCDNMVYIFGDNLVFGVDLYLLDYIYINVNKVISRIQTISKVYLEGCDISNEYSGYLDRLDNQKKFVPFLYLMNKK